MSFVTMDDLRSIYLGDTTAVAASSDKASMTANALALFGQSQGLPKGPSDAATVLRSQIQQALAQLGSFQPWTDSSSWWNKYNDSQTVRSNLQQALKNVDVATGFTTAGIQAKDAAATSAAQANAAVVAAQSNPTASPQDVASAQAAADAANTAANAAATPDVSTTWSTETQAVGPLQPQSVAQPPQPVAQPSQPVAQPQDSSAQTTASLPAPDDSSLPVDASSQSAPSPSGPLLPSPAPQTAPDPGTPPASLASSIPWWGWALGAVGVVGVGTVGYLYATSSAKAPATKSNGKKRR